MVAVYQLGPVFCFVFINCVQVSNRLNSLSPQLAMVNKAITDTKIEYLLPVYSYDNINNGQDFNLNPQSKLTFYEICCCCK